MKLSEDIALTQLEDKTILIPTGKLGESRRVIVYMNETAAFIVECLKNQTTTEQIVDNLLGEYAADRAEAEKHVVAFLDKLRQIGAIEE